MKAYETLVKRIDFFFLALIIGVLILNVPYWNSAFVPRHDSMWEFELFYYFYNEYFFNHVIAQWMPYGVYGVPAAVYQIGLFTPAHYLVGFLGKLCGITDVMMLLKVVVIFEELIFLAGIYLLARLLFKNRMTILLVVLASFCSFEWFHQMAWNFKLYYLFPLVLFLFISFFEYRRASFFWMAMIASVLWAYGISWYLEMLWVFLGFLILTTLFMYHPKALKNILPRQKFDFFLIGVLLVLLMVFLCFLKGSFDNVGLLTRAPGANNPLDMFLRYGGNSVLNNVVMWFFLGMPTHTLLGATIDNTAYASFAAAVLFIWAAAFVRNKYFIAILIGFLALVWLSFGGLFASMVYYFPGMHYFRHVGLSFSLVKILLALGAGFGLADFLQCSMKNRLKRLLLVMGVCVLLIDIIPGIRFFFKSANDYETAQLMFRIHVYFLAASLFLFSYLIIVIIRRLRLMAVPSGLPKSVFVVILTVAVLLDVISFQRVIYNQSPKLSEQALAGIDSVNVSQLPYVEQRSSSAITERQYKAFLLAKGTEGEHSAKYDTVYSFMQIDPCGLHLPAALRTTYINEILNEKFSNSLAFQKVLGCQAPKLRLLKRAQYFVDNKETIAYMKNTVDFDNTALIKVNSINENLPVMSKEVQGSDISGEIVVRNFTSNELNLKVNVHKQGGWLVYADSYAPGWRAYVNGSLTKVFAAYVAFKGIFLPKGTHEVRFVYFNEWVSMLSYGFAFLGLLAGAIFFVLIISLPFRSVVTRCFLSRCQEEI